MLLSYMGVTRSEYNEVRMMNTLKIITESYMGKEFVNGMSTWARYEDPVTNMLGKTVYEYDSDPEEDCNADPEAHEKRNYDNPEVSVGEDRDDGDVESVILLVCFR